MQKRANSRMRYMLVAGAFWACIWLVSAETGQLEAQERGRFPLAATVPSEHFAVLGMGNVRGLEWGVYVYRGSGPRGGAEPCAYIASAYPTQSSNGGFMFHSGSDCGKLAPPAASPIEQRYGLTVQKRIGGELKSMSILAFLFAPSVRRVELDLEPGPSRAMSVRQLSGQQTTKARVRPLSYLALGLARKACVRSVTAYDATGNILVSSPERTCPGE